MTVLAVGRSSRRSESTEVRVSPPSVYSERKTGIIPTFAGGWLRSAAPSEAPAGVSGRKMESGAQSPIHVQIARAVSEAGSFAFGEGGKVATGRGESRPNLSISGEI